ncbi:MAG: glycosyltransferase family 2 protein [Actinomycetota bacterium]
MTRLTVCIPAYNAAEEIERAIRSIHVDEVDGDVEILVCDDGSDDGTASIVERLTADIPSIRLLRNRSNRGRPVTRNRLLSEARGDFLTWLDADDEKYPGMLRAQLEHLQRIEDERGEYGLEGLLVYTNYDWWWTGWERPRAMTPEQPDDPMMSLLDASFGGYLWLMMGTRQTFLDAGPFDERLPRLQDLGFFIRFAELGGRFERVDDESPLCVYHKDDRGRDAMSVWRAFTRLWKTYRHHYTSYGMFNARRWRRHHYRVARRFARGNDDTATHAWILTLEVLFVIRGRFRRLIFDA